MKSRLPILRNVFWEIKFSEEIQLHNANYWQRQDQMSLIMNVRIFVNFKALQQTNYRLLLGSLTVPIFSFCCFHHVLIGVHFIIISSWLFKILFIFLSFLSLSSWLLFYWLICVTFNAIFFSIMVICISVRLQRTLNKVKYK